MARVLTFGFGKHKNGDANPEVSPEKRQLRGEDDKEHSTGLGISLNDFMDKFEEDMAPEISEKITLTGCEMFELVTTRLHPGASFEPSDEVEQRLAISREGDVRFSAHTYNKGAGKLGIGRVEEVHIPKNAVTEICNILDSYLFAQSSQSWETASDHGKWFLRVRFEDGREEMSRGQLGGAFFADMDVSEFIRQRVPISNLYLFDETL